MAYATVRQFAERSGLGIRVIDENVGTGAGTSSGTQSFDLDNDNIIQDTFFMSHAPSGNNDFKVMTSGSQYSLDLESGRFLINGTVGAGQVGTDVIYSSYTYIDRFSGSVAQDYLNNASDQVDKLTGRRWGSGTTTTEYRDGRRSSKYPTTDQPYMSDWDRPDSIVLKNWPVQKIDHIFFLSSPVSISKFFNNGTTSGTFKDLTTNVNSSTETTFALWDSNPTTGDRIYIGSSIPFLGLTTNLSTDGSGTSAVDWEYYNGNDWADITETETDSGASTFIGSGKFTWTYPFGWAKTTVNSSELYWVRGILSDGYTTNPVCATMTIHDSLSTILEPRQVLWQKNGVIDLMGVEIPDGQQNIRIDYTYGMNTLPRYIEEMTILIASLQAYVERTGGSFDDFTTFQLGSKSFTIGEAWVNIREVISQINARLDKLMDMVGKRSDIAVI